MTNLEKAKELIKKKDFDIRSCWNCNPSHEHMKNSDGVLYCFSCGEWFFNGVTLSDEVFQNAEFITK